MGCPPDALDNRCFFPVARPRWFWHSLPVRPLLNQRRPWSEMVDSGWQPAWLFDRVGKLDDSSQNFGTFLRPFPPGKPRECSSVDFWRLPLSCYSRSGLVVKLDLNASDTALLRSWFRKSVDIPCHDVKTVGSASLKSRLAFATWVHREGGCRLVRPLLAHERELGLGFPIGAGAIGGESLVDSTFQWPRMQMSGNSFSPSVVAHVVAPWAALVMNGVAFSRRDHRPSAKSREEALRQLLPNGSR